MDNHVTITGSHGHLVIDWTSGEVITVSNYGGDPYAYSDITRFDVQEWQATYPGKTPSVVDICDIGYWTDVDYYEPPAPEHRAAVRDGMGSLNVPASHAAAVGAMFEAEPLADKPRAQFTIGDPVRKIGGDYSIDGWIAAIVTKRSGAIRYVVEDERGMLLIYSAAQLAPIPTSTEKGEA